jgi:multicomponent Na+:H+ antiporter subunit C
MTASLFNTSLWFALVGAVLVAISVAAFLLSPHPMKKLLAFNVMGSGVFLVMVGMAQSQRGGVADPVPQALVLTGIVVAVSATALALVIIRRYAYAISQGHSAGEGRSAGEERHAGEGRSASESQAQGPGKDKDASL